METPEGFGCVEPGLYRAAGILPECLPFVASLGLKSILALNPGNPLPAIGNFAGATGVELVHMPLQPWRAASDYTTFAGRILRDAVQFVLDKRHYPLLVVDTNIFVGIIRKLENWTFSAILAEYVAYTGVRAHYTAEVYLEMLEVELKTSQDSDDEEAELPMIESEDGHDPKLTILLPPQSQFPDWFVPYYKLSKDGSQNRSTLKLDDIHVDQTAAESIASGSGEFWIEINGAHDTIEVDKPQYKWEPPSLEVLGKHHFTFGSPVLTLKTRVSCGDAHTGQILIGYTNGELILYNSDGHQQTKFDGHILHTSVAKFFPSGQVVVSAGMDYAVKIWDAGSGSLAQTLKHQKGMIDAIEIIERGRNIVTLCSRDNSIVLWEVGGAKVLREIELESNLQCMALVSGSPASSDHSRDAEDEYGVAGKSLILGSDSAIYVWDFRGEPRQIVQSGASTVAVSGKRLAFGSGRVVSVANLDGFAVSSQIEVPTPVLQVRLHQDDLFVLSEGGTYRFNLRTNEYSALIADPTTTNISIDSHISRPICWSFGQKVYKFQ